jgi:2,4-dienoyl-CoA reductase-like NADH-dependent reductase (Old Yellow Enzyme family)
VEKVHEVGGKIFPQLWHAGSVRQTGMPPDPSVPGYGPSPILHPSMKEGKAPKEMSVKEIEDVIAAFTRAAHEAKQIGFDGIELHGAHGYLNEFDLIAVGRALLADPEWVTKVIDDRFEEINTFTMESLNTLY